MPASPLLMIPGPVEVAPSVVQALSAPPPGHASGRFLAAMQACLRSMRTLWRSGPGAQPFILPGGGTAAMEMAVSNAADPGTKAVVVRTGLFSDRMAEMLRRRGAEVLIHDAAPGEAPDPQALDALLRDDQGITVLALTHVDTSTGVLLDLEEFLRIGRNRGVLTIVDAVCSLGAEPLAMLEWGAWAVVAASQKALGGPPGLALVMASPWALEARRRLAVPPPLSYDYQSWTSVMEACEEGRFAYFGTPATGLVLALEAAMEELFRLGGEDAPLEFPRRHRLAARAIRAGLGVLGLEMLPARESIAASGLSAVRYPRGIGSELLEAVLAEGVVLAPGLHPQIRDETFRIGHLGPVVYRDDALVRTVEALGRGLRACGREADVSAAVRAAGDVLAAER